MDFRGERQSRRSTISAVSLLASCFIVCVFAAATFAQPAAIHYAYDELGRLVAVIDRNGDAGVYEYDAVGNIMSIERVNAADVPGPIGITFVAPGKGKPGASVTIFGKGFGNRAALVSVTFNGTSAAVGSVVPNRISTVVPAGATTGPIHVTAALGSATSPRPFKVLGPITVDPASALVAAGGTRQFSAKYSGGATASALWLVSGVAGGGPVNGTVSTEGLYTAPPTITASRTVTLTAIDRDDVTATASASITLVPPAPLFVAIRGVSVARAETRTVNRNVGTAASVAMAQPATVGNVTASISVRAAEPDTRATTAPALAVAIAPVVTGVVPAGAPRGASDVLVTITGVGLEPASDLVFLRNNAADPDITVTNVVANGDGTQLTADVSIAAGAALGGRVVQVVTPAGNSTPAGTGGNVFTVQ